jgi:hypothetical protein
VVIAGILASQFLARHAVPGPVEENHGALFAVPYHTKSALSSFDQLRSIFGSILDHKPDLFFVESISKFYAKLVASQEPLGPEFSRVLHENLWDLYER